MAISKSPGLGDGVVVSPATYTLSPNASCICPSLPDYCQAQQKNMNVFELIY